MCKLDFFTKWHKWFTCAALVWIRVSKTSLSGNDPLSELVLRVLNSKCALMIYYFMLQDRVGLGSK
jgi:hypothetical protein